MTTPERVDVAALRAVVEAADPTHSWEWHSVGEHGYPQQVISVGNVNLIAECYEGPDFPSSIAEHIAAFDPPTALALLDEIETLRATVARLGEGSEHWRNVARRWEELYREAAGIPEGEHQRRRMEHIAAKAEEVMAENQRLRDALGTP